MNITTFQVRGTSESLPAILLDTGEWFFSAQDTCVFAEVATPKNATTWIKNNIPPKWYREIKIPGKEGRPSIYLTKPGFYYAVCQGKSLKATNFRDWVFEDLLVKIESQGFYVMQQYGESLTDYQKREKTLIEKNQELLKQNKTLYEGEFRQLVKLFVDFVFKCFTNYNRYVYPNQFLPIIPRYSFEQYWLAYWMEFKNHYAVIPEYLYEYRGSIDLDSVDLWLLLKEVDNLLRHHRDYKRLKQRDASKPIREVYDKVIKTLML